MDPGTAMMVAQAVAAAAKGGGEYFAGQKAEKASKRRAKEMKRETLAQLLDEALNRSAQLEAQRLQGTRRLGQRRTQSLVDTADLIRGAFTK